MNVSNGQARTAGQSSIRHSKQAGEPGEHSNSDQDSDTSKSALLIKVVRQDQSAKQCLGDDQSSMDILKNQPSAVDTLASSTSALDHLSSEPSYSLAPPGHNVANTADPAHAVGPDHDTSNVPGIFGDAAAGFQGASEFARDAVNRSGTRAAANLLTNGSGSNLPAPGIGSRADLAKLISGRGVTAADAIKLTPFTGTANSTQILSNAADNARKLDGVGRLVGLSLQPTIGAVQGLQQVPEGATLGEHIAGAVGGSLKEFDDAGVSYTAGFLASAAATSSAFGAPAAPAAGIAAGIAAGRTWDGSVLDGAIDRSVDNYITPAIADGIDDHITPAARSISKYLEQIWSSLNSWFKH